jgi:hypothetical protein
MYRLVSQNIPRMSKPQYIIDESPFNKRAWVAQERYLPPRILHFARDVLFWECRETLSSETHPDGVVKRCSCAGSGYQLHSVKNAVNDFQAFLSTQDTKVPYSDDTTDSITGANSRLYISWCMFRSIYNSCQLTQEDDVFVALRGIGQQFEELLNDRLVFGLWQGRLLRDLAWYSPYPEQIHRRKSLSLSIPSWSWARLSGVISGSDLSEGQPFLREVAQVLSMLSEIGASVKQTYPLIIQCGLITANFKLGQQSGSAPEGADVSTSTFGGSLSHFNPYPRNVWVYLDDGIQTEGSRELTCCLLILRTLERVTVDSGPEFEGLLIVESSDCLCVSFKRIGFCRIVDDPDDGIDGIASRVIRLHKCLTVQTIHLV